MIISRPGILARLFSCHKNIVQKFAQLKNSCIFELLMKNKQQKLQIMNTSTIAIYKTSDVNNIDTSADMPILRRVPLEEFTSELQHIHENGDLYGVYQDDAGNVVAFDNEFTRHENIIL